MTASQPKTKMKCQLQSLRGKERTSSHIWKGNELSDDTDGLKKKQKKKTSHVFTTLSCHHLFLSLWGKGVLAALQSVCPRLSLHTSPASPPPPSPAYRDVLQQLKG